MLKKISLIVWLLCVAVCNAQILDNYPKDQDDYLGGNVAFYRDFHRIALEKNLQPCQNKGEQYLFTVVVYPDSTIKYVKDKDSSLVEKNKCAFDLSRKVAKYLKAWNPAVENREKVAAITSFWIFPDDLFQNYVEGYDAANFVKIPEFEGGIQNFRKQVVKNVDIRGFNADRHFKMLVVFDVNEQGKMEDVHLAVPTKNEQFNRNIIAAIQAIKQPWKPAMIKGTPFKYRFKLPLSINYN